MNKASFVYVVRYADGRIFPAQKPLPPEVSERLRGLEHRLRCAEGMTFRAVQRAMMERFGARRSLGQIFNDLRDYECGKCSAAPPARPATTPAPAPQPDPAQRPRRARAEVFAWR